MSHALKIDPANEYAVVFDFGFLSVRFDGDSIDNNFTIEDGAAIRMARILCWDSVLIEAADRLTGDSPNYGYGRDQKERAAFLEAVKVKSDARLTAEVAELKRETVRLRAEGDRMFTALGGGGDSIDRHSWACDVRFGRGKYAPVDAAGGAA